MKKTIKEIIELLIETQGEIESIVDGMDEMKVDDDEALQYATGFRTNSEVLEHSTSLRHDSGLLTEAIAMLSGINYTGNREGNTNG